MPTVAELTIGSLRSYADAMAEQRAIPAAMRRSVINVLNASSYLDTDRLIDLDLTELDGMLAASRPDLAHSSRSTYIGQLRHAAQMLIDHTAAQHGDAAPILTRRPHQPAARGGVKETKTNTQQQASAAAAGPAAIAPATALTFPFPLRPGLTVTLTLPTDLTAAEAERLTQMIKLLPVSSR